MKFNFNFRALIEIEEVLLQDERVRKIDEENIKYRRMRIERKLKREAVKQGVLEEMNRWEYRVGKDFSVWRREVVVALRKAYAENNCYF